MIDKNIQESLHQRYNPEGSLLRQDQLIRVEVLKHFADICKKNEIKWWLCGGTLLGAVRHGGFIPWDDDVDITMCEKDFNRLEEILMKEKSDIFFYQCYKTDPNYVAMFSKYRLKKGHITPRHPRTRKYKHVGLGFDIFVLQETSTIAARISASIYSRIVEPWYKINNQTICNFCTSTAVRLGRFICKIIHIAFLPFKKRGELHFTCGTGWAKTTFKREDIFPLSEIQFEGVSFPSPGNINVYLRKLYGDYMKLPNEEQIKQSIHCKEYRIEIFGEDQ